MAACFILNKIVFSIKYAEKEAHSTVNMKLIEIIARLIFICILGYAVQEKLVQQLILIFKIWPNILYKHNMHN